jgi:hypothetical protein
VRSSSAVGLYESQSSWSASGRSPCSECAATNTVVSRHVVAVRRCLGVCFCITHFEFPPSLSSSLLSFLPLPYHKYHSFRYNTIFPSFPAPPGSPPPLSCPVRRRGPFVRTYHGVVPLSHAASIRRKTPLPPSTGVDFSAKKTVTSSSTQHKTSSPLHPRPPFRGSL